MGSGTQMASSSAKEEEEETETGPHPNQSLTVSSTHRCSTPAPVLVLIPVLTKTCSTLKAPAADLYSVGPHSPLAELIQPNDFKDQ